MEKAINTPMLLRSLLFVPATNEKLLESALGRNADAIQLDLEDAIPLSEKEAARQAAKQAIKKMQGRCPYVVVRINAPLRMAVHDLESIMGPGLDAITVPKVPHANFLRLLDETITEMETEHRLTVGAIRLIAMIENAEGLIHVNEIASATSRLLALIVGTEDLSASLGSQPVPDAMYVPHMLALAAARHAEIIPLGYLGSITVYQEKRTYREWVSRAALLGFEGAFCIHPSQVEICNEVFQPSAEEIDHARQLIDAFEKYNAAGVGVFAHEGRMVDAPVIKRARNVLAKVEAIQKRSENQ